MKSLGQTELPFELAHQRGHGMSLVLGHFLSSFDLLCLLVSSDLDARELPELEVLKLGGRINLRDQLAIVQGSLHELLISMEVAGQHQSLGHSLRFILRNGLVEDLSILLELVLVSHEAVRAVVTLLEQRIDKFGLVIPHPLLCLLTLHLVHVDDVVR